VHVNRLGTSTSPYLRQHADNPVDWWPWGPDALAAAAAADKPLLISIGYSACHWCHVMAHESFEDLDTAAVMSQLFVNVKIDREEHPDVDALYMAAVQSMTGHGGWPLTVWAFPDGRPFYGGTYFPKVGRGGGPGFVDLCRAVDDAWRHRREELDRQADELTAAIARASSLSPDPTPAPLAAVLDAVNTELHARYDENWGGFSRAPKFPQPDVISAALLCAQLGANDSPASPGQADGAELVGAADGAELGGADGVPSCSAMAHNTVMAMASGGIYDHLGGGFARYSTDAFWMVPHFEKMLYDQAQILAVLAQLDRVVADPALRHVAAQTVDFLERELANGSCFASALDADSEGEEGKFYVWSYRELAELLTDEQLALAVDWYGITKGGNFEGANILHRPIRGDLARPADVEEIRRRLFDERARRVRPGLDDKVLTEWNAYLAAALASAAAAFDEPAWLARAETLCDVLVNNTDARGHLRRCLPPGAGGVSGAGGAGGADSLTGTALDVAALLEALTVVAEVSGQQRHLDHAERLAEELLDCYWDPAAGGVFTRARDLPALAVSMKDVLDNATPSANSLAAVGLVRLGLLRDSTRYSAAGRDVLRLIAAPMTNHPLAFAHALPALVLNDRATVLDIGATLTPAEVPSRPGVVVRHSELARCEWGSATLCRNGVVVASAPAAAAALLLA
jgi:uncharacterized protein YyaL (SSP411 family)